MQAGPLLEHRSLEHRSLEHRSLEHVGQALWHATADARDHNVLPKSARRLEGFGFRVSGFGFRVSG